VGVITFLKGCIVEKQPTRVVLDVGGVGYEILIPLSSYEALPGRDAECRILTYDYVREDNHLLFGFMSERERRMFVLLMGISGVGPKLALSALSGLSVQELTTAAHDGDVGRLSSISGIGKKTAERLVVELRHRLGEGDALDGMGGDHEGDDRAARDAVMALMALGHKDESARKMVNAVIRKAGSETLTVEDIIKRSLGG
jgi:Holliday junction DNA helicase RuvA